MSISEKVNVLVVDDDAIRHEQFVANNPKCSIVSAYNVHEAISHFDSGDFSYISLDHDLGEESDVIPFVKHMAQAFIGGKKIPRLVVVHSMNPVGAENAVSHIRRLVPCYLSSGAWGANDFFTGIRFY